MDYDVLVIGGGIAGMESAINLGDMDYKVLLAEKEPSIGGKMILLSKVFPTLDCASCIATPKMASTANHPNVDVNVYTEIEEINKTTQGTFQVKVRKKSSYVDNDKCTGCQDCEVACTLPYPDQYNSDLVSRKVAHIVYPQAVPKKAILQREGTSPCTFTCPSNIKANGYIALAKQGDYEKAFHLVMEDSPLVSTLGRACYAPCQGDCTRGELEGTLPIRQIKRSIADKYYAKHPEPEYTEPEEKNDKKIAIIGSGPAGLTAAYFLGQKGYQVEIFEKDKKPGGMLRYGIPTYRLPRKELDRDIKNITALGVQITTEAKIESVKSLLDDFDAIFVSIGSAKPIKIKLEGDEHEDVEDGITFLKQIHSDKKIDLTGKDIIVVGGGNVAIDVARVALRLGAKSVNITSRSLREEMSATIEEIHDAQAEGIIINNTTGPSKFVIKNGKLQGMEVLRYTSQNGKKSPIKGTEKLIKADKVYMAIGQKAETKVFEKEGIELNPNGTLKVNKQNLTTSQTGIFAGGEAATGPSMIVTAAGEGKKAAFFIDRYLKGEELNIEFEPKLSSTPHEKVLRRNPHIRKQIQPTKRELPIKERIKNFEEVELGLSDKELKESSERCLNCGICCECQECVKACPADAIDFARRDQIEDIEVGSVIVSTGFKLFEGPLLERYGFGKYQNVITSMQMDRMIAPTRPFNSIIRPLDGKVPDNIAYIFCVGSRDNTAGNPICSRVCCMYSIKQAQLLVGALPLADVTLYYIDIRAFGKGYEEFYKQSSSMGVNFTKGKVAKIRKAEEGNLIVRYEDIDNGGKVEEMEHDLVVLSVGFTPNPEYMRLFGNEVLESDHLFYVNEPELATSPAKTNIEGVFVAGAATGPMDIPDTIIHSGAAAAQAAAYIERSRRNR